MATHIWNDETEGDVWLIGSPQDPTPGSTADSSDSETTLSSLETIDSTEIAEHFRVEYGRAFPVYEELPMALPADQGEIYRLRIQHLALKQLIGDTLHAAIEGQLAPTFDGRQKRILDVRTQSGIWAEEMAVGFPSVDIKTIDVAPAVAHYPRVNLHYEVYDIHEGILEPEDTFDIVHARHSVNMASIRILRVKDWTRLLKEIHRVLRPGGMLIFGELDPRSTHPGESAPCLNGPGHQCSRFFEFYRQALVKEGVLIEAISDVDHWLHPDSGLWNPTSESGFYNIRHRTWEAPLNGLWHPDPEMQQVGILTAKNFCEFIINARPLFLSSGVTESEYDLWVADMHREIRDPMNNSVIRYHLVTAFKM